MGKYKTLNVTLSILSGLIKLGQSKFLFLYDSGNLAKFNVSELTEELKQKVLQDKNELIDIVIE